MSKQEHQTIETELFDIEKLSNLHPVIQFYLGSLEKIPKVNLSFDELMNMPDIVIGEGYFWIPWLLPCTDYSKWNRKMPKYSEAEILYFQTSDETQKRFLIVFDRIMQYFGVEREGGILKVSDEVKQRNYWLKNIGHQQKKISRIIRSLYQFGNPTIRQLAINLQELAIELGKEKGYLLPNTLEIWEHIFED